MLNWKVLGLEASDGERCECCGTCCPKRRVVLTSGGEERRYGTACAAFLLLGSRKKTKAIEDMARQSARDALLQQKGRWVDHRGETILVGCRGDFGWKSRYYPGAKFIPE